MSSMDVGKKLVDLCRKGKFKEAMESLYDPKIVSIEAQSPPGKPARMDGIDAVRGKAEWWEKNHEVHKCDVEGPGPMAIVSSRDSNSMSPRSPDR